MLIVNDDQLRLAGIVNLEERCTYCSKTLAAYPLIMSDDAKQTVYHVTCALELATEADQVAKRKLLKKTQKIISLSPSRQAESPGQDCQETERTAPSNDTRLGTLIPP